MLLEQGFDAGGVGDAGEAFEELAFRVGQDHEGEHRGVAELEDEAVDFGLGQVDVGGQGHVVFLQERGDIGAGEDSLHEAAAAPSEFAAELDEELLPVALGFGLRLGEGRVPVEGSAVVEVKVLAFGLGNHRRHLW